MIVGQRLATTDETVIYNQWAKQFRFSLSVCRASGSPDFASTCAS